MATTESQKRIRVCLKAYDHRLVDVSAGKIVAEMKDFDFGDYAYEIVKYSVYTSINKERKTIGNDITGGKFNSDLLQYIKSAKKGQEFFFYDISAKGPDNKTVPLGTIRIVIEN